MVPVRIFVGGVRPLPPSGRPTGMFKSPVSGPLHLGVTGFAGDQQADTRVHGGPDKAVHLYPASHYPRLAQCFADSAAVLVPGALGENLSTEQLDEAGVCIGDVWALGAAQLQVCQPRNPCWKIDDRCAADGMAGFIAQHRLTGWYFRVTHPGVVQPGAVLERIARHHGAPTLADALRLCQQHRPDLDALQDLAHTPGIAAGWRDKLLQRWNWLRQAHCA